MGRSFNGASEINFGSDASIDGNNPKGVLVWVNHTIAAGNVGQLVRKDTVGIGPAGTGWTVAIERAAALDTGHVEFRQEFDTTDGIWDTPDNSLPNGALRAVAVGYNHGATGNDPDIHINATLEAEAETGVPTGAAVSDAANDLRLGSTGAVPGASGTFGFFVYDNTHFTAAQANRHRWWGYPGGPVDVWHPLWTESLTNKGTATANGTLSGPPTMDNANLPRVKRRKRRGSR